MKKQYLVKIYKQNYNKGGKIKLIKTFDCDFYSKKDVFKHARYEIAEITKEFFLNYEGDFNDKIWAWSVNSYRNLMQGCVDVFENEDFVYYFKVFKKIKD